MHRLSDFSESLGITPLGVGHAFFHHPLKKRINMLQLTKSPRRRTIYAFAGMLMIAFTAMVVMAQAKKGRATIAQHPAAEQVSDAPVIHMDWKPNAAFTPTGGVVFTRAERMPELQPNLGTWIGKNVRYPDAARAAGVQGKSVVQFVVDANGLVGAPTLKTTSGHAELDEEALRAVRAMPQWKPGTQQGNPVPVLMTLPFTFKLNEKGNPVPFWEGC